MDGFADTDSRSWRARADALETGGCDLYPDPLRAAVTVVGVVQHPLKFYRKLGFVVVGVLPDANGFGKPDILMPKRVARS